MKGKKEPKGNGAPAAIVLGLSGLRCADIVRGVRDVKGKGEVAKVGLFLADILTISFISRIAFCQTL